MARTREFDPDEALEKAMHQFWAKGYYDTSIRDLVDCTGVNYYGLYSVFENKHGLFLASLDLYQRTVTEDLLRTLEEPGSARQAIRRALERVAQLMQTPGGRVGCLMCNTAIELAPHDREAAKKVKGHFARLQAAFQARLLVHEKAKGEARREDFDGLAEFFSTTVYSIGMLTRLGRSDATIARHIETALKVLD